MINDRAGFRVNRRHWSHRSLCTVMRPGQWRRRVTWK